MFRKLTITVAAVATVALSAGFAGQADAATSTVLLHTQTSIPQLLTDTPSGVTSMDPAPVGGNPNQRWVKTDTDSGYATYSSVSSISAGSPRCLTGRGIQGFPVVTAEKCIPVSNPASTKQQWKLGVSGDLQLRLNGLVAGVNSANNSGVAGSVSGVWAFCRT
jgi:hypothetical protein